MKRNLLFVILLGLSLFSNLTFAGDKNLVGIFNYTQNDIFINQVNKSLIKSLKANFDYKIFYANDEVTTQIDQVETFMAQKPFAIIVNPVDVKNAQAIYEIGKKYKTPIIFFNREPNFKYVSKDTLNYYVGLDAYQSGIMQAQIIENFFKNNQFADKNNNKKIDYILIKGPADHQDTIGRTNGFTDTINKFAIKGNLITTINANFDFLKAQNELQNFLENHDINSIEAIIANNDSMALGCLDVLQLNGYNLKNSKKYIPIVGVDGISKAIKEIDNGNMLGTVVNNSNGIAMSISRVLLNIQNGQINDENNLKLEMDDHYIKVPYVSYTK